MSAGSGRRAAAAPRVLPAPRASKVELRLSCRHLLDRDPLTKSDPSVVLLLQSQSQWVQVDRTEVVRSSLHPVFSKVFTLDYYFEEVQKLRFEVYDTPGPCSLGCQDDDFLGGMECTLGQIVAQKKMTRALLLRFGRNAGKSTITVIAEDISGNNGYVELSFRARKLDDKDLFSKSDPFLELYRVNDDRSEQLVYRTEVVKNNLSPVWEPFKVSLCNLCSCEETRPLKCLIWDYDSRGKHDFIGEFSTTFEEMQKAFREDQVSRAPSSPRLRTGRKLGKSASWQKVVGRSHVGRQNAGPEKTDHHAGQVARLGHRSPRHLWKNAVQGWGLEAPCLLGVGVGYWCSGGGVSAYPCSPGPVGLRERQVQAEETSLQELGGRDLGRPEGLTRSWTTSWAAVRSTSRWLSTSRPPMGTPATAALCTTSTPSSPTSTCRLWWPWGRSAKTTTATRGFLLWALEPEFLPSMRCPMTSPSTSTLRTMSVKASRAWWRPTRTACPGSSSMAPPTWPPSSPRWPAWPQRSSAAGRRPNTTSCWC
ncbi:copine-7 isoform X4 [Meles meles]|uniref:copine-7 isoform X4 n=1 Tax=Meles meles TaxID=9662 RepID=UPI001E6A0940|nr:copine-7 isoform X4 [Meles meles]